MTVLTLSPIIRLHFRLITLIICFNCMSLIIVDRLWALTASVKNSKRELNMKVNYFFLSKFHHTWWHCVSLKCTYGVGVSPVACIALNRIRFGGLCGGCRGTSDEVRTRLNIVIRLNSYVLLHDLCIFLPQRKKVARSFTIFDLIIFFCCCEFKVCSLFLSLFLFLSFFLSSLFRSFSRCDQIAGRRVLGCSRAGQNQQ